MTDPQDNVSAVDSNLYCTIFGDNEMRAIIGDTAFERRMVEVEVTLAKVQARLGMIPQDASEDIATDCRSEKLDRLRLRRETNLVGLPVWGLVRQLNGMIENESSARFLHGGLNTHDIMDLARTLQMKDALDLISRRLDSIRAQLVRLIHRHRETPMIARTHLQHALPSTFGCRLAIWLSPLDRHVERLVQIRPRVLLAQVGGASGSLASLGAVVNDSENNPDGLRLLSALSKELGLVEPPIPWHAARDGLAEVVSLLALIGGSVAKIALDIALLQIPEIGELAEPFVPHRGASSTMPHKSNPVLSEAILALGKMLRQEAGLALDAVPSDFERAGSGTWQLEWAALPQSFTYCSAALKHTEDVLTDLRIYEDRMRQNLNLSKGMIAAEHVVVALHKIYGRSQAHDIIYKCCQQAWDSGLSLGEVLKTQSEVKQYLSDEDIDWYCDPANYLGLTMKLIDRVLAGR